ncbi:MAG: SDR family NAD(P)-dependent oxidoreductase [Planctomycetota bacterium]|nr:SDR family NAD(P)-dependent oxidoreductase [Planctomycetota bacterium]
MPIDLRDKGIIITGASSGIGAATAIECAKAGMHIVLNARREDKLKDIAHRIEKLGRKTTLVVGSVTDDGMTQRLLDEAERTLGGFHAVFSNAGYGLDQPAVDLDDASLRNIFEVNFFASVDLINSAARRLLEQKRQGHLLMNSSCLAKFTLPHHSAYSATKAAQNHFCRAMRLELRPDGIEVSSVHPITTTTEFFEVSQQRSGNEAFKGNVPDHAPRMFIQPPEKVAKAIVKCLRKPRPEVWTSHIVRATASFMTLFPSSFDLIMRKQAAREKAKLKVDI